MQLQDVWKSNFEEAKDLLVQCFESEPFVKSLEELTALGIECYKNQGKLMACGNGGSHCDAMHLCEELTGKYRKDRKPLGAIALGDASHVTCVSNDYGYEYVFSRQVEALGKKEDLFVGISTSGYSQNVILAAEKAKALGMKTVALTGKSGGTLKDIVDLAIIVPSQVTDRIQEVHIKIIHTLIQSIERHFFPENY